MSARLKNLSTNKTSSLYIKHTVTEREHFFINKTIPQEEKENQNLTARGFNKKQPVSVSSSSNLK